MVSTPIRLEIHLEWDFHAIVPPSKWPTYRGSPEGYWIAKELLRRLEAHGLQATWYVLGDVAKNYRGFIETLYSRSQYLGSHGYWHQHGEAEGDFSDRMTRSLLPVCVGYRSPFWDTTPRPGLSGGVFFRLLPYTCLKRAILSSGVCYLHPHDFMQHPIGPLRRRLRFCDPWQRFDRLLKELAWAS